MWVVLDPTVCASSGNPPVGTWSGQIIGVHLCEHVGKTAVRVEQETEVWTFHSFHFSIISIYFSCCIWMYIFPCIWLYLYACINCNCGYGWGWLCNTPVFWQCSRDATRAVNMITDSAVPCIKKDTYTYLLKTQTESIATSHHFPL